MRYLVAFLVPPLAILMCKRPLHAVFNLAFWLLSFPLIVIMGLGVVLWLLCVAHAIAVCRMSSIDKRIGRLVDAITARQIEGQPSEIPSNG